MTEKLSRRALFGRFRGAAAGTAAWALWPFGQNKTVLASEVEQQCADGIQYDHSSNSLIITENGTEVARFLNDGKVDILITDAMELQSDGRYIRVKRTVAWKDA